jgi:hypothetical protein
MKKERYLLEGIQMEIKKSFTVLFQGDSMTDFGRRDVKGTGLLT